MTSEFVPGTSQHSGTYRPLIGNLLRVAAQVVAVDPDRAVSQAGRDDAPDRVRADGGGRRGDEGRAEERRAGETRTRA